MNENELIFEPLSRLSELVKNRTISSEDLVYKFYNHILQYDKKIKSICDILPLQELLAIAKKADMELDEGSYKGPLHGIPMTVKDSFKVTNLKNSNGYPPLKNYIPNQDAYLIKKLKSSGAIIVGKTNLPLLAIDWKSENNWCGRSNNPYDLSRVPGGSSGGAAAALASGFTPIEIGSDAGGSIRVPAHFCGVCGLRPTEGLLSNDGQFEYPNKPKGLRYITVPGPMARNLTDMETLFNVLLTHEDETTKLASAKTFNSIGKSLNIAYSRTINNIEVDRNYQEVFDSFIQKLKKNGFNLTEAGPDYNYHEAYTSWATIMGFDFGINMPGIPFEKIAMKIFLLLKYRDTQFANGMFRGMSGNIKSYARALETKDYVCDVFDNFLTKYDAWITPVSSNCAFFHQRTGQPFVINNKKIGYTEALGGFNFTTALPGHPICTMPIGSLQNNMPVGVQIHGKRWNDRNLIEISKQFEKLTDGYKIPPMFVGSNK